MKSILDQFDATGEEIVEAVIDPFAGAPGIHELRGMFESFDTETSTARDESFRDRSYYDGDGQIGMAWRDKLNKYHLPPIYINKIRDIVDGHVGVVLGQQVDPECQPRKEADIDAAAVGTKILRYVADSTKWKQTKSDSVEDKYIMGATAVLVEVADAEDMSIMRIPYREFCYDPRSRLVDFSDANWLGFGKWVEVDDLKIKWPDSPVVADIQSGSDIVTVTARGFDRNVDLWTNKQNRSVQVITMYYREGGKWFYVVWCHAGILDWSESPYRDDRGRSICPIVAMSCYISGDTKGHNARYGIVRDMINPQDEYNAHRAQALQYAVSRRVQRMEGSTAPHLDPVSIKEIAADPRGVMPDGYTFVPDNGLADQISLLQLADSEMSRMGPTPAVLGRSLGASESGRSRQVQAAAGLTEMATILDRVERFEDGVYRMIWQQVRQYWQQENFIRVTGQDRSYKFVTINKPVIDPMMPEIPQMVVGEDGQPVIDPMTGAPQMEMVPNIIAIENEVARMDLDVIITTVPENVNLEHETWQQILQFSGSTGIAPGDPRFIMMLKVAPLTNRNEVIEKIEGLQREMEMQQAEAAQAAAQMQQQAQQLELEGKAASNQKDAAQAAKYAAEAGRTNNEVAMEELMRSVVTGNLGQIL